MFSETVRKSFLYVGIALLTASVVVFLGEVSGVLQLPANLLAGETSLHSIVRVAVAGCVLAAIGCWES